jgi:hypothetical protein
MEITIESKAISKLIRLKEYFCWRQAGANDVCYLGSHDRAFAQRVKSWSLIHFALESEQYAIYQSGKY